MCFYILLFCSTRHSLNLAGWSSIPDRPKQAIDLRNRGGRGLGLSSLPLAPVSRLAIPRPLLVVESPAASPLDRMTGPLNCDESLGRPSAFFVLTSSQPPFSHEGWRKVECKRIISAPFVRAGSSHISLKDGSTSSH